MAYEDWVKVVPHPPLWRQMKVDSGEGGRQLFVQLEEVTIPSVDVPVGHLCSVPVAPLLNL